MIINYIYNWDIQTVYKLAMHLVFANVGLHNYSIQSTSSCNEGKLQGDYIKYKIYTQTEVIL